jgi:tetratricopeptide (TPR) repeat protein
MNLADTRQVALNHCHHGVAHATAGDLGAALADFHEALRIDPDCAEALNNRGFVRQLGGDPAGARADFDAALQLDPNLASAYANRGGLRLALWDLDGALADLDRAVALDPRHCAAHLARAHTHYHLRDLQATEDDFRTAFALDAAYVSRCVIELLVQAMRQNPRAILQDCHHHLQYNPGDFHSLARRGLFLLLQGRDAEAAADFDQYRLLNPGGGVFLDLVIEEAKRRYRSDPPDRDRANVS